MVFRPGWYWKEMYPQIPIPSCIQKDAEIFINTWVASSIGDTIPTLVYTHVVKCTYLIWIAKTRVFLSYSCGTRVLPRNYVGDIPWYLVYTWRNQLKSLRSASSLISLFKDQVFTFMTNCIENPGKDRRGRMHETQGFCIKLLQVVAQGQTLNQWTWSHGGCSLTNWPNLQECELSHRGLPVYQNWKPEQSNLN